MVGDTGCAHVVASLISPHSSEWVDIRLETLIPCSGFERSLYDPLLFWDFLLRFPDPADPPTMVARPWLGASIPVSRDSKNGFRNGMQDVIIDRPCSISVFRMYAQNAKASVLRFPFERVR